MDSSKQQEQAESALLALNEWVDNRAAFITELGDVNVIADKPCVIRYDIDGWSWTLSITLPDGTTLTRETPYSEKVDKVLLWHWKNAQANLSKAMAAGKEFLKKTRSIEGWNYADENSVMAVRLARKHVVKAIVATGFIPPAIKPLRLDSKAYALAVDADRDLYADAFEQLERLCIRGRRPDTAPVKTAIPLTDNERRVVQILAACKPREGRTGKEIINAAAKVGESIGQSELTSRLIPALKNKGVGIDNQGAGYFLTDANQYKQFRE